MDSDRDTFTELVDRHGAAVAGLLRRLCRNAHDADDVFQETATRVWRHLGSRPAVRNAKSWLMTVAYRAFLDHRERSRKAPLAGVETPEALGGECPSQQAERSDDRRKLDAAVAELSPALREVIVLHYSGGLSIREVAAATGLSVGTVKSRLNAGLVELRRRMS